MDRLVLWQRTEGAGVMLAAFGLYVHVGADLAWWIALLLILAPDLGFAGYVFGPKIGARAYNVLHLYALGAGMLVIGLVAHMPVAAATGALWLAHVGFDRMLGYGLKSEESFNLTHLGRIGRSA